MSVSISKLISVIVALIGGTALTGWVINGFNGSKILSPSISTGFCVLQVGVCNMNAKESPEASSSPTKPVDSQSSKAEGNIKFENYK